MLLPALLNNERTSRLDEYAENLLEKNRERADTASENHREGTGVLLVTHETCAEEYADSVWKMDAGSLLPARE